MTEQQLTAFLAQVQGDARLQKKIQSASDADALATIAKDSGFMISVRDLKNPQSVISDEELEGAAGGATGCVIFCHTQPNVCP